MRVGGLTNEALRRDDEAAARWVDEALRLNLRYQLEIVEACGLCPWAERSRVENKYRARVLLQTDDAVAPSLAAIDALAAEARVEVAVLIYPRMQLERGRPDFEAFMARMREADSARHAVGRAPFVFAAFHPDALPNMSDPERLIPFLRRTPDPTIQLLRSSVLDHVRRGRPQGTQFVDVQSLDMAMPVATPMPLYEAIARANFSAVERMGVAELGRRLDALQEDRRETYRSLGDAMPADGAQ